MLNVVLGTVLQHTLSEDGATYGKISLSLGAGPSGSFLEPKLASQISHMIPTKQNRLPLFLFPWR